MSTSYASYSHQNEPQSRAVKSILSCTKWSVAIIAFRGKSYEGSRWQSLTTIVLLRSYRWYMYVEDITPAIFPRFFVFQSPCCTKDKLQGFVSYLEPKARTIWKMVHDFCKNSADYNTQRKSLHSGYSHVAATKNWRRKTSSSLLVRTVQQSSATTNRPPLLAQVAKMAFILLHENEEIERKALDIPNIPT